MGTAKSTALSRNVPSYCCPLFSVFLKLTMRSTASSLLMKCTSSRLQIELETASESFAAPF